MYRIVVYNVHSLSAVKASRRLTATRTCFPCESTEGLNGFIFLIVFKMIDFQRGNKKL